jgi:hypothetical protein
MERNEEMMPKQKHERPLELLERRQAEREVVHAFLASARRGDLEALQALLDPDVVLRADSGALPAGASRVVRGARAVVEQTLLYSRLVRFALPALVDGAVGVVTAPRGKPFEVLGFSITRNKIVAIDILAEPARLRRLDLAALDG